MRITKSQLRKIIKEEAQRLEEEGALSKGIDFVSKKLLNNPDEWKSLPEVQELKAAAAAAAKAGVPAGAVADYAKRAAAAAGGR